MEKVVLTRLGLADLIIDHDLETRKPSTMTVLVKESVVETVVEGTLFTVDPSFVNDEQEYSWNPTQKQHLTEEYLEPEEMVLPVKRKQEQLQNLESQHSQEQIPTSGRGLIAKFGFKKRAPASAMNESLVLDDEVGDDLGDLLQGLDDEEEPIIKRIGTQSTISVGIPRLNLGASPHQH